MQCGHSVKNLEVLNLNGCQKISDMGIDFITYNCPKLMVFSIYWNVRYFVLCFELKYMHCFALIRSRLK